jgi:hypothetical protein
VSASASREIEAAVKALQLETKNSPKAYDVEDSLRNLFGSDEITQLKIDPSAAFLIEDVEQIPAAVDQPQNKEQQIETSDFNEMAREAVDQEIPTAAEDKNEVGLTENKEQENMTNQLELEVEPEEEEEASEEILSK